MSRPDAVRTPAGDVATELVLGTFRANGLLLDAGGRIAAQEGLTAARWQVLGAIVLSGRPLTVPQIARRMGLTRQAVQVSVNGLVDQGLVMADANPDHRRSSLFRLTALGTRKYRALDRRQAAWIDEIATGFDLSELATTVRVLEELSDRLDTTSRSVSRRSDPDATT